MIVGPNSTNLLLTAFWSTESAAHPACLPAYRFIRHWQPHISNWVVLIANMFSCVDNLPKKSHATCSCNNGNVIYSPPWPSDIEAPGIVRSTTIPSLQSLNTKLPYHYQYNLSLTFPPLVLRHRHCL